MSSSYDSSLCSSKICFLPCKKILSYIEFWSHIEATSILMDLSGASSLTDVQWCRANCTANGLYTNSNADDTLHFSGATLMPLAVAECSCGYGSTPPVSLVMPLVFAESSCGYGSTSLVPHSMPPAVTEGSCGSECRIVGATCEATRCWCKLLRLWCYYAWASLDATRFRRRFLWLWCRNAAWCLWLWCLFAGATLNGTRWCRRFLWLWRRFGGVTVQYKGN